MNQFFCVAVLFLLIFLEEVSSFNHKWPYSLVLVVTLKSYCLISVFMDFGSYHIMRKAFTFLGGFVRKVRRESESMQRKAKKKLNLVLPIIHSFRHQHSWCQNVQVLKPQKTTLSIFHFTFTKHPTLMVLFQHSTHKNNINNSIK